MVIIADALEKLPEEQRESIYKMADVVVAEVKSCNRVFKAVQFSRDAALELICAIGMDMAKGVENE